MTQPAGSWPSPYSAARVASSSPRIDGARFVGEEIWWGESVPEEGGRVTVRNSSGAVLLPAPWNARSRVHEYGGGAWEATANGTLFFVDARDQRVRRLDRGAEPIALTPAGPRYGGLRWQHHRLLAVREDLTRTPHLRAIVEIPVDGSAAEDTQALVVHAEGPGFFAHPTVSADGTRLAWVEWDGRRMPWDDAALRVASRGHAAVTPVRTTAALQPEWRADGTLLYLDDPTGRWNIHSLTVDGLPTRIASTDADTGGGLWVLGTRWYQPLDDRRILAVRTEGDDALVLIRNEDEVHELALPADAQLSIEHVEGSRVLVTGIGSRVSAGLWCVDADSGEITTIRGGAPLDPQWMPAARHLSVEGVHGRVHAFAYAPVNPEADLDPDELAPYVVFVHGGPTAHVAGAASSTIAFYTSRGIGVLDVNYGGSTGYGRAYRDRLLGEWGVVDVDDVIAAVQGLVQEGGVDPERIAIRGGSAGGWTVLSALVRGGVFAAGISRYGVADLRMLVASTHDFEKHYIDELVGPFPEAEHLYIDRSPLTHADRVDVPVLLLQGTEDAVVPPSQSAAIRDALAARGIAHEYVLYPGEGHGFRAAETIVDSLERELRFLGKAFGFTPQL